MSKITIVNYGFVIPKNKCVEKDTGLELRYTIALIYFAKFGVCFLQHFKGPSPLTRFQCTELKTVTIFKIGC
jgi:hypothetical protein